MALTAKTDRVMAAADGAETLRAVEALLADASEGSDDPVRVAIAGLKGAERAYVGAFTAAAEARRRFQASDVRLGHADLLEITPQKALRVRADADRCIPQGAAVAVVEPRTILTQYLDREVCVVSGRVVDDPDPRAWAKHSVDLEHPALERPDVLSICGDPDATDPARAGHFAADAGDCLAARFPVTVHASRVSDWDKLDLPAIVESYYVAAAEHANTFVTVTPSGVAVLRARYDLPAGTTLRRAVGADRALMRVMALGWDAFHAGICERFRPALESALRNDAVYRFFREQAVFTSNYQ